MENFKKTEDLNKVKAYYDAQKAWMHQNLNPEPVKADQDAAMAPLTASKKVAEDALPKGADVKIIDTVVADEANFKKFKISKIDSKTQLNKDCVAAGECSEQTIADITKAYLIADGVYTATKATEDQFANVVKAAEDKIDNHTFAIITTCDATAGIHVRAYDGEKCEGKPEHEFKAKWGACVQSPDGESFVKITGAAALQAAAVAVVAFAGSQF